MQKLSFPRRMLLPIVLLAVFASTSAHASFIIDDFTGVADANPWPLIVNSGSPLDSGFESGVAGVLGGNRQSALFLTSSQFPLIDNVTANIFTVPGLLDFTSSSGAAGNLQLIYGGENGLNADFSSEVGFVIDFLAFDFAGEAPMAVEISVWDGSPNETGTASLTQLLTSAGSQSLIFNIADFQGDPVNWQTIQIVTVTFNGNLGTDFRVSQIATFIPTPGVLCVLGLAWLKPARRRRM